MTGLKKNTIKTVLHNYISKFVESIEDEQVKELVRRDTIVTGGAIASMLLGETVNDYDVYFRTKETTLAVARYYCAQFNAANDLKTKVQSYAPEVRETKITNIHNEEEDRIIFFMKSAGMASEDNDEAYDYFENGSSDLADAFINSDIFNAAEQTKEELRDKKKKRFRPVFLSDNAVTLSDKIQVITRFWGEPSEIHRTFDFAHAMCYYDYHKRELVLPPAALECLLSKTLVYHGSLYPIASLFRIRKFIARGWRITAGQMLKIVVQLNGKDLTDTAFLREQLMGVDVAYMHELISALKAESGRIDSAYLVTLIDKIFKEV